MGKAISELFNNALFYKNVFQPQVKHTIKTFKPNKKVIEQGNTYPFFCYIKSGSVRVILNEDIGTKNNIHTVIATLEQDDFFGEFRLFGDYAASADVITVTETEIIMVDVKSFRKFLEADKTAGYNILLEMLQNIIKRLHHSNVTVLHLLKSAIDFQNQLHKLIRQQ